MVGSHSSNGFPIDLVKIINADAQAGDDILHHVWCSIGKPHTVSKVCSNPIIPDFKHCMKFC
jgi:hypothetical protein